MAKISLAKPVGGYNLAAINDNFTKIEQEFQNKVAYRDNPVGEANTLETNLDINGKRLYNLGAPQQPTDALRLIDIPVIPIGTTTAGLTTFAPGGGVSATNVQGAISELDTEKASLSVLASSTGSTYVGSKRTGTTTTKVRNLQTKLQDLPHFLDYDVDPTGVNDSTSEIVKIIADAKANNFRRIYGANGTFVLTSPVLVDANIWIDGVGTSAYTSISTTVENTRGNGTWFHLAHSGIGFNVSGVPSGVKFSGLGTFRTQPPVTGAAYTPSDHSWDFSTNNASDVDFHDVNLLNATRGIRCLMAGSGRVNVNNLKGQPLLTGLEIVEAYDICRIHDVHFWPFWTQSQKVWDWMIANATGIRTARNDNPFFSNLFTIFYGTGLEVVSTAAGTTNKLKLVNGDFDRGRTGVLVSANGHVGTYTNVSSQGETGLGVNNNGLLITGSVNEVDFHGLDLRVHGANSIRVQGVDNKVTASGVKLDLYNQAGTGFPAIEAAASNNVYILGDLAPTNGGTGPFTGGAGVIRSELWVVFNPALTAGTGAIGSWTTTGKYKIVGDTVSFDYTLTITDAGTAGSRIIATLPYPVKSAGDLGSGRESVVNGKSLAVVAPAPNTLTADIYVYDNTFPGVTGAVLRVKGSYEVA